MLWLMIAPSGWRRIFRMFSRIRSEMMTVSLTEKPTMVRSAATIVEVEFVVQQDQHAGRHQHIVRQCHRRADAEAELEAERDVDAHHQRRDQHGEDPLPTQLLADAWSDGLGAQDIVGVRPERGR